MLPTAITHRAAFFLSLIFCFGLHSIPAEASNGESICTRAYTALSKATHKVTHTYGARLLLVPESPNTSVSVWHGFGRIQGPVQSWALPFYPLAYPIRTVSALVHMARGTFTPNFTYPSLVRGALQNTYFLFIREGTRPIRETLLRNLGDRLSPELKTYLSSDLVPSGWVDFTLAFISFNYVYAKLDAWYKEFAVEKQKSWIEDSSEHWLSLLQSDPHYSRLAAIQNSITTHDLVQEIFLRSASLDLLYLLIDDQKSQASDLAKNILSNAEFKEAFRPVLPATIYLTEHAPETRNNFSIPTAELHPANTQQLQKLIDINMRFLKRRSLLRAYFEDTALFEKLKTSAQHATLAQEIAQDPQITFYKIRLKEKKIDLARAKYLSLEWALIQERFERWEIYQAERLVRDDEGVPHPIGKSEILDWRQANLQDELPYDFGNVDIYPSLDINSRKTLEKPLNNNLNKLVFLRSVEPGTRTIWNGIQRTVKLMGSGSARTGIAGEKVSVAVNASSQMGNVHLIGTGDFARGIAIFSSAIVYADLIIRWNDLKNIQAFVEQTGKDILYLQD